MRIRHSARLLLGLEASPSGLPRSSLPHNLPPVERRQERLTSRTGNARIGRPGLVQIQLYRHRHCHNSGANPSATSRNGSRHNPEMGLLLATVRLLSTRDGGRPSAISLTGSYRPHVVIHGGDGTYLGVIIRSTQTAALSPGDHAEVLLELPCEVDYSPLAPGTTFDILEGPRIVGSGKIHAIE